MKKLITKFPWRSMNENKKMSKVPPSNRWSRWHKRKHEPKILHSRLVAKFSYQAWWYIWTLYFLTVFYGGSSTYKKSFLTSYYENYLFVPLSDDVSHLLLSQGIFLNSFLIKLRKILMVFYLFKIDSLLKLFSNRSIATLVS